MGIDYAAKAFRYRLVKQENEIDDSNIAEKKSSEKIIDKTSSNNPLSLMYDYSKWIIIVGVIYVILCIASVINGSNYGIFIILVWILTHYYSDYFINNGISPKKE